MEFSTARIEPWLRLQQILVHCPRLFSLTPLPAIMTTAGVWDPNQHGIDMKRKSSFSLLDQIKRPMDGADENPDQKEKMETR